MHYDFLNLEVAYCFYKNYARANGFPVRKGSKLRNSKGEITQQAFLCNKAGFREDRGLRDEDRQREEKPHTRCGCRAEFRVHVDNNSGRWEVRLFRDMHNHDLVPEQLCGLIPGHRKMSEADILQMNNLQNVGITIPDIYGAFASQVGGYLKVGFRKKDMYNEAARQRRVNHDNSSTVFATVIISNETEGTYVWLLEKTEADFESDYGQPPIKTPLCSLELSAAVHFTREMFNMVRRVLVRAVVFKVNSRKQTVMCDIYTITKFCKHRASGKFVIAQQQKISVALVNKWRLYKTREIVSKRIQYLRGKYDAEVGQSHFRIYDATRNVGDPSPARRPDHGRNVNRNINAGRDRRRPHRCSLCRLPGHNRNTCPSGGNQQHLRRAGVGGPSSAGSPFKGYYSHETT
ncbi:FAR1 DNA-binding domain [Sesbania bispinosa]|nr:FAR1 DNA-binding domain [Sesbania bispinosa]